MFTCTNIGRRITKISFWAAWLFSTIGVVWKKVVITHTTFTICCVWANVAIFWARVTSICDRVKNVSLWTNLAFNYVYWILLLYFLIQIWVIFKELILFKEIIIIIKNCFKKKYQRGVAFKPSLTQLEQPTIASEHSEQLLANVKYWVKVHGESTQIFPSKSM